MASEISRSHETIMLYNVIRVYREGIVNLHNKRDTLSSNEKIRSLIEMNKIVYSCLSLVTLSDDKTLADLQSCYTMLDDLYNKSSPDNSESLDDALLVPELSVRNLSEDESSDDSDLDNENRMNNLNRGIDPTNAFRMMNLDEKKDEQYTIDNSNSIYQKPNKINTSRPLARTVLEEYADELSDQED